MKRTLAAVGGAVLALLPTALAPAPAVGHEPAAPKRLRVMLTADGRARLVVSRVWGPGAAARRVRQRFDRDADGTLSGREADALRRWMQREALRFVELGVNGQSVTVVPAETRVGGVQAPVASTGVLQGQWHLVSPELPLIDGWNRLRVRGRYKDGRVGVPLEIQGPHRRRRYRLDGQRREIEQRFQWP